MTLPRPVVLVYSLACSIIFGSGGCVQAEGGSRCWNAGMHTDCGPAWGDFARRCLDAVRVYHQSLIAWHYLALFSKNNAVTFDARSFLQCVIPLTGSSTKMVVARYVPIPSGMSES